MLRCRARCDTLDSMLEKIISGGQTGADRAALDAAAQHGFATGGWVPKGRAAEDGAVPLRYRDLVETDSPSYASRTRLNVETADATIVFTDGRPTGGTAFTIETAKQLSKPFIVVDVGMLSFDEAANRLQEWLGATAPVVLNVAGPRGSESARSYRDVYAILSFVFSELEKSSSM
jgi:predicted Rossmann-fold nucleotide-binding protein